MSTFFAFIFAVLLPIFVTGQGEVVNSSIVTQPTLLYFHFYLCGRWNLITNWYQSWHSGSRDVIGHVTIWFPGSHFLYVLHWHQVRISNRCGDNGPKYIGVMTLTFLGHVTSSVTWPFESQWHISYWWSIGPKSLSPSVIEIFGIKHIGITTSNRCRDSVSKYIGAMTLTFLGHVTSSVTWPFESQWAISYWWSIGPKSLSPSVFDIFGIKHIGVTTSNRCRDNGPKYIGAMTLNFWVTWRHQSRNHSNPNGPFPIGGPLDQSHYI